MGKLIKCSVCNYIYEGEEILDNCPLCGAPKDKMAFLSEEVTAKTYNADYTNGIHTDIINLAITIVDLCEAGIEDNLDPMCVKIFEKSKDLAWQIKQMSKAEIENHIKKEKW